LESKAIVTTDTSSRLLPDGTLGESFDVGLEGVVYTLVDVHEGHDEDFERWYESDHFYAGGVLGPYVLSGRRWYASKALRESRFVGADCPLPDPNAGTNLATYFLTTGGLVGFYDWIVPQLMNLRSSGRMFADRTHFDTSAYRLEQVLSFPAASAVPPHVALDHPFAGVFVAYLDPAGEGDSSVELPAGTLALSLRPNVGALTAESLGVTATQPGMGYPSTGDPVRLVLAFLTEAPLATREYSADLSDRLGRLTGSRPQWGGALLPVIPGSREHVAAMR
jgi:hypothetical protein